MFFSCFRSRSIESLECEMRICDPFVFLWAYAGYGRRLLPRELIHHGSDSQCRVRTFEYVLPGYADEETPQVTLPCRSVEPCVPILIGDSWYQVGSPDGLYSRWSSVRVVMPEICGFLKIPREREIPLRNVNPEESNG